MSKDDVCSIGIRFKCGELQRGDRENGLEVALRRQEGRCPSPGPRGESREGNPQGFNGEYKPKGSPEKRLSR